MTQQLREVERERSGPPYNEDALNTHSTRTYVDRKGFLWELDKNLSLSPPFFHAVGPYAHNFRGFLPNFKEYDESLSWAKMEQLFFTDVEKHSKLKSEQQSSKIKSLIIRAFNRICAPRFAFAAIFEHGKWWIMGDEKTWSVVDAEGIGTYNGFAFEEV